MDSSCDTARLAQLVGRMPSNLTTGVRIPPNLHFNFYFLFIMSVQTINYEATNRTLVATVGRIYYQNLHRLSVCHTSHVTLLPCSYLHNRCPHPCQILHTHSLPAKLQPPGPWGIKNYQMCKNAHGGFPGDHRLLVLQNGCKSGGAPSGGPLHCSSHKMP